MGPAGDGEAAAERGPRRLYAPNGAVVLGAATPVPTPVCAATLAVPLAGVTRASVLLAPVVALAAARAVAAAARSAGVCAYVDPVVSADLVGVTVELLAEQFPAVREVPHWFARACRTPPPDDVAPLTRSALARMAAGERWSDQVRRVLFGPWHRYGTGRQELAAATEHVTAADLQRAGEELACCPPVLAVCPPDLVDVAALAARLAELPGLAAPRYPAAGPGYPLPVQRTVVEVVPGTAERAYYLRGTPGVRLASPDKYALHVAWAMLGGRDGMLDRRLRVARALTYSLAAFSREFAEGGYGLCYAGSGASTVDDVAAEVAGQFARLVRGAFRPALVDGAKERLAVQHLTTVQAARGITERLCGYQVAGVDPAFLASYPEQIGAVTPDQVVSVARRYLRAG